MAVLWITIGQQCQKHHDTNGKSNRRKAIADAAGVPWWKQRDLLLSKGGSNDDRKMKNGARTMGGKRGWLGEMDQEQQRK